MCTFTKQRLGAVKMKSAAMCKLEKNLDTLFTKSAEWCSKGRKLMSLWNEDEAGILVKGSKSWWALLDDTHMYNHNFTASRYSSHQAEAQEHEPPEVLINRLLDLEREIQSDLEELLEMISSPKKHQPQEARA